MSLNYFTCGNMWKKRGLSALGTEYQVLRTKRNTLKHSAKLFPLHLLKVKFEDKKTGAPV